MELPASLGGVYPIAPTPFHDDGQIDCDSIDRLTDFCVRIGVTGIVEHLLGRLACRDHRARV
jgi:4-hydroxy-tetrahydrodipicolinate synthase